MNFTLDCPACFERFGEPCRHRHRYNDAQAYIAKQGVATVVDGCQFESGPAGWWKGGEMVYTPGILKSPDAYQIWMYSSSCKHWGWDMLTSILIHEFGHTLAYLQKVNCQDTVGQEHQANHYGYDNMPAELIPEQYWPYRRFCLMTYTEARL